MAGAYQVAKNIINNVITVSHLPLKTMNPWLPGICLITGNITNTITLDGNEVTGPVCNARVHIMSVETELLYPKFPPLYSLIPDWVINELINNINEILKNPPVPDPIGPVTAGGKFNVPLQSLSIKRNLQQALKIQALPKLPQQVINGLTSSSLDIVRQTLADYHLILHPYICLWPIFWPWFYKCNQEAVVYTDSNGHFDYWEDTFIENLPQNIYIRVCAQINGQWVDVYNPQLANLLGSCDEAAFAETLYVWAFHTNGTSRLENYDSSYVAAFAVKPQS